jgi:hypothetical protein
VVPRRKQSSPRGPIESSFAAQLDYAMKLHHLTPETLAALVKITGASVRNYLRGRFLPKQSILTALEDSLQVRFDLRDPAVTRAKSVSATDASALDASSFAPGRLSIMEAKLALARNLGVSSEDIQIIVRG